MLNLTREPCPGALVEVDIPAGPGKWRNALVNEVVMAPASTVMPSWGLVSEQQTRLNTWTDDVVRSGMKSTNTVHAVPSDTAKCKGG